MSREKELAKNTIIVFIGKIFTQFISFLLIPLYTFCLDTDAYGYIDLIQSYIMIIVPTLILRFDSSIFRFLVDSRKKEDDKRSIISSSFYVIIIQSILFIIIAIFLSCFIKIKYIIMIIVNVVVLGLSSVMLQIPRGNGNMVNYSIASIICGVTSTLSNILFIAVLKFDASYILLSSSIGNLICCFYIFFSEKVYKYISITGYNGKISKDMLKYSLPLIPDGLSWWIVNASDRTIISFFLGATFNGIYAISCKFSNILATFFTIFNLTWQESASIHVNDNDRDVFFTDIFNIALKMFSSICLGIMVCVPIAYRFMVGKNYIGSYLYIPILLLGNLFNAMANVAGGIYIAKKETKKVARTTIIGAIFNIITNLLMIKVFGLWAAAISTAISYVLVCIYRYVDINKQIKLRINLKYLFVITLAFAICVIIYYINNMFLNIINLLAIVIFSILLNKNMIIQLLKRKR